MKKKVDWKKNVKMGKDKKAGGMIGGHLMEWNKTAQKSIFCISCRKNVMSI